MSIVLPVHNQADHIEAVVTGYEAALSKVGCRHELILVCNNCRDQSLSICQELARSRENIRVINSLEGGWGLAVKLGLKHAAGAWLAYTNSARTRPGSTGNARLAGAREPRLRRQGVQAGPHWDADAGVIPLQYRMPILYLILHGRM